MSVSQKSVLKGWPFSGCDNRMVHHSQSDPGPAILYTGSITGSGSVIRAVFPNTGAIPKPSLALAILTGLAKLVPGTILRSRIGLQHVSMTSLAGS
jgi:hypothetical protein